MKVRMLEPLRMPLSSIIVVGIIVLRAEIGKYARRGAVSQHEGGGWPWGGVKSARINIFIIRLLMNVRSIFKIRPNIFLGGFKIITNDCKRHCE